MAREPGIAAGGGVLLAASAGLLARAVSSGVLPVPVLIGAAVAATALTAAYVWWRESRSEPATSAPSSPHDRRTLFRLMEYARRHRRKIQLATACSIVNKVLDFGPPFLIGLAVDLVTHNGSVLLSSLGFTSVVAQLWLLGGLTVAIWLLESLSELVYKLLWRNIAQSVQHELRIDAYTHVQNLEIGYFEDQSTGGLAEILNGDINQLESFLSEGANNILQLGTNLAVVGVVFAATAPSIAWIAILPVPLILWSTFAYKKRISTIYSDVRDHASAVSGYLVNNLGGIVTIKSFTNEEVEVKRIRRLSQDYVQSNQESILLGSAFTPLIRIAVMVGFTGTLILGGMLVIGGRLNPGSYALMVFLVQRFLWPLISLGKVVDGYQRAMASADRVFELLDTPAEVQAGERSLPVSEVSGEIDFDHVGFSYPNGQTVLRDFSIRMPAGKITALVGATGSGKTTVVKLLLRFHEVSAGSIRLDGHDIRDLNIRDLRNAIGLVTQDVFLFDGTVRENIEYGRPGASLEDIAEAARLAEASAFVEQLPEGYQTVVGERGVKLSGGQRQRLCIARMILKDPPILVLDEATSSVDNETEAAIQRSLERISKGRTTLVIAHRLSTVRHADHIYVLGQGGSILEQGNHKELVKMNGFYASLWRLQTGASLAAPPRSAALRKIPSAGER